MNELVWLIVGLLLGGCLGIGIHCCFLINRTGYYEQEIRKLSYIVEQHPNTEESVCQIAAVIVYDEIRA